MEKQELRQLLEQLRREIERTDTVDEKALELLKGLQSDIHNLLARADGPQPPSTLQRWEETIAHLEVDHPTLTATLSQLLASLSNAGI